MTTHARPCLGHCPPHEPLSPDAEQVTWQNAEPARFARDPRVLDWTCECRLIIYEKTTCAGVYWIRRTDRTNPHHLVISETCPGGIEEINSLWEKIVSGAAV
ncbi:hypothetical protein [Nonomuraea sp. NPDC049784]|uniref:hypothetical protein n=1 Tax=Nonomuraea sp. NPDC049784 TaxID=3154361 RepID=UPI00340A5ADB